MSEEELNKTIDIVASIEVHSEAEATAKEELISYIGQLQQENHILKQAVDNTYETSQDIMYEMQQENEHYKNILTEFEKWLEEKIKCTEQYADNDMAKGYINAIKLCKYYLQELKEGKK